MNVEGAEEHANHGDATTQFNLGFVSLNYLAYFKVASCFTSADQGHEVTQFNLECIHEVTQFNLECIYYIGQGLIKETTRRRGYTEWQRVREAI